LQVRVAITPPWDVRADVLAVPIVGGEERPGQGANETRSSASRRAAPQSPSTAGQPDEGGLAEIDRRLDGALGDYRRVGELSGKVYGSALLRGNGLAADWVLGMGLGKLAGFDRNAAVRYGAAIERRLGGRSVRRLAVWLPEGLASTANGVDTAALVELVVRGVVEGSHEPAAIYRETVEARPPILDELTVIVAAGDRSALTRAAERGRIIGEGANRARVLAQRASNDVSPEVLADEATAIARSHGLTAQILGPEQAAKLGMNLFLAVGRGSDNPPRFIVLRSGDGAGGGGRSNRSAASRARSSRPGTRASRSRVSGDGRAQSNRAAQNGRLLAMVGKGVTFDSGGISIKPADRMEEMKMDKTGACTVISALATVAELSPGIPLMAIAPAVENMPGPHSTRPGDVVKALNGKIVEIQNTDAEGRLILGDALAYAERQGATHLVDVATLTGAVERAFGKLVTGAFATPQSWYDEVVAAGARQGERYWQVPLVEDYVEDLESWYADFQNTGGNEGSLVKSGLFLQQFVTRPWAHLDIGGTAYLRKPTPWTSRGATGVTHATLVELALGGVPNSR
jgi:leucyl aminopeptidase